MTKRISRILTVAAIIALYLRGSGGLEHVVSPLTAQTRQGGETMPGPIIEDPPGPYRGTSYVPARQRVGVSAAGSSPALSTFIVTYNGFTPEAQAAFQAAVDVWASQVQSPVPIRVTANWTVLGTNVLGSAGPLTLHRDFSGTSVAGTWFPAALANKLAGSDLSPSNDDIQANFNSNFVWYYGTDGNAGTNFDLMSVVLHELGHGLGFIGSMRVTGDAGFWGSSGFPYVYDLFAVNGASQFLLNSIFFPNGSPALATQLTSNSVFFSGSNAANANVGNPARLYAPSTWSSGSSYSHLDEATFPRGNPNSLMTPQFGPGEAIHDTGGIVLGAFNDMGWNREPPPAPLQFVPVTPCRIVDTRESAGPFGGPLLPAQSTRQVSLPSSACGVPATAAAYSLNVTAIPTNGTLDFLTVWPAGQAQPNVSTLNSPDGSILANAAIVRAGAGGAVNVFVTNDSHFILDINGYFVPPTGASLQFHHLSPCRLLDTRNPIGPFGGPAIEGGSARTLAVASSSCGVPAEAAAYSLNVTAVPDETLGFVTAWPAGQNQPLVSTLNSLDGTILANAAIVPAGAGGDVSFFASDTTDLIVDINGYFAPAGGAGLNFYAVAPCRVVDTRNSAGPLGGPIIGGGSSRTFQVQTSTCGPIAANAAAYSLNTTVVPSAPLGFLTVWATGQLQPLVSTLNAPKGLVVANAAIAPASAGGAIDIFASDPTHVIVDLNGFFGP